MFESMDGHLKKLLQLPYDQSYEKDTLIISYQKLSYGVDWIAQWQNSRLAILTSRVRIPTNQVLFYCVVFNKCKHHV